ncbi:MAG: hypothetical protein JSR36_01975 [Proteobacteria bacterium]|nr:hypothetical protein [Pseudomonadota bacterium]
MPGHSRLRAVFLTTLLGAVLGACSHKQEAPRGSAAPPPPPFASSNAEEESSDAQDPCRLLDPKEVEAVLGEPLAVPPFRVGSGGMGPHASGSDCMYETKNFRYLTLTATFEGGQQEYSLTQMVKGQLKGGRGNEEMAKTVHNRFQLDDGTELSGEWDEASLTAMNCCIFNALRGDQLLVIDFTGTRLSLRQVAPLLDAAFKRMDKPLPLNGNAAVGAALALDKTRPQPRDVCSLLTRTEVEAIVGPLGADPAGHGHDSCTYAMPRTPGTVPLEYDVKVRWRNGYYQWRSDRHVSNLAYGSVGQIAHDVVPGLPAQEESEHQSNAATSAAAADPAESVSDDGMNYVLVKQDVEISVNSRFVDRARAQALVVAVAAKI